MLVSRKLETVKFGIASSTTVLHREKQCLDHTIQKNAINKLLLFCLISILCCGCSVNSSYNNGVTAYKNHNYLKALQLFKKAAESGDARAQNMIAFMYYKGIGVKQDFTKSFNWHKQAADNGYLNSMLSCGYFLHDGIGTSVNTKESLKYYNKAFMEKGDDLALRLIVDILIEGNTDAPPDYEKAIAYILLGNYKKHAILLVKFAELYQNGWGVKKNIKQAENFLRQAIKLNQQDSYIAKAELAELLLKNKNNLEEAKSLIIDYISKKPKSSDAITILGRILYHQKKYNKSLVQLKKASMLAPNDANIHNYLGDAYQALNKTTKAREEWKKAIELTKDEKLKKEIKE